MNRIGCAMVGVLAASLVNRRFDHRSGLTKDYEIAVCCSLTKHAALRNKSKDWLARFLYMYARVERNVYLRTVFTELTLLRSS